MIKNFDKAANDKVHKKIARTQRIIVTLVIICIVLPFFLAWMNGSIRF